MDTMSLRITKFYRIALFIVIVLILGFFTYIYFGQHMELSSILKTNYTSNISTIIVPHYNLESEKRLNFIKSIKDRAATDKIVLISVNHLNEGNGNIIATDKKWDFFGKGNVKLNQLLLNNLTSNNVVKNELGPFTNEHGVFNVLPDLVSTWPDAQFLPIIIKDSTPKSEVDNLLNNLNESCPDCLIVASIDLSHYNPNSLAQIHDSSTISALSTTNANKAWSSETDSPQSMYLATSWANLHKTTNFHLNYHTNSGELAKDNTAETTSYLLGYYTSSASDKTDLVASTSFLFGGDLMFDRGVNHFYKDTGIKSVFDNLGNRVFWGVDLAIANLEGPISETAINDDYLSGSMIFNFPPDAINALKYLGVNALSLANNHSENAGQKGLDYTRQLLTDSNITPIGSQTKYNSTSVKNFKTDISLAVIGVDMLEDPNLDSIDSDIKANEANYVIVYPHWGAEYQVKHGSSQENLAKRWIDAGADLIIGSHPHVVQDCQIYKGKFIAYSMGNFVFDQNFSQETMRGMLVGGIISKQSTTISLFPISINKSQPQLSTGSNRQLYLDRCLASLDNSLFNKVSEDTITINN
jgi:poly-gamma-glutamate synthesis protein (capsule biosynthesis protein)